MELKILGDYHLIKMIGQGTLGTVYLAEHRFMKRHFILKVLPEELSTDRGFVQRFEEEIGLLASLDHPNIVKVHNISFAQGQYFLVSDCIVNEVGETTNLTQYLTSLGRRLEEDEVYHLLLQIAKALDYAHAKKIGNKGMAHRGIKPNNILVGKRKGGVEFYLSDFGLSRIIGSAAVLSRTYKNVAEALGIGQLVSHKAGQERYPSPSIEATKLHPLHTSFLQNYAFLAPEQKKMDNLLTIDSMVDVYAFGVLAYFLLNGEYPEGVFDMPSVNGERVYNWDALIKACLQYHPGKRPLSLTEILQSLPQGAIAQPDRTEKPIEKIIPLSDFQSNDKNNMEKSLTPLFQDSKIERPNHNFDPAAALHVETGVKHYHPEIRELSDIRPIMTEMVIIPGGLFKRGSRDGNRDEMPQHQIKLSSFAMDTHAVTNEQFVRFLEVMGGEKDSHHNDIIRLKDSRIKRSAGKLSIESGYAKHPVVGVTWYGAIAYAKWVGKRLPTEAEWEVAARGGQDGLLYPFGEDIEKTEANFFSSDTTAVMSYAPNSVGLYDIAGNVYEWCNDWYGYNYYEVSALEPENPQGPLQGVYRVLRGGCWKSLKEDLRCSKRHRNNPGTVNGTYGFRCAADVIPSSS